MLDRTANGDAQLLVKLNKAVAAANEAEKTVTMAQGELVSTSKAVGLLLLEAKKLHPAVKEFHAFLARVDGLKLSRAYDLMRLAGGRATEEEIRKDTRDRVKKHRDAKKLPKKPEPLSVTSDHVTEKQPAKRPAEQQVFDSPQAAHGTDAEPATLSANQASALALDEFTHACRALIPKITVEADRLKALALLRQLLFRTKEAA
jgi:hypothetical protein